MKRHMRQCGATLVEVMVAIALAGIMLPAFAEASLVAKAERPLGNIRLQSASLVRQAAEAVRVVREANWQNVTAAGTYHPVVSGNTWTLVSGSEVIGTLTRSITLSAVQRNTSGNIVTSGGTVDPSTMKAVITVSWAQPVIGSVSDEAYLGRWQNNAVWTQTTQTDFAGGTLTNTSATASNTVQLLDSPATWQLPSTIGTYNVTGNVSGLCVFGATISSVPYAFVGYATGMAIVNVSNPASPTLTGTFATSAAVNGIFVSGTTAYLATAITNAQLKIVNVSNPASPSQAGTLKVGGTSVANGIFVSGTTAYMVKSSETGTNGEFNVINVSNPAAPTLTGKLARQSANFLGVYVSGTTAYVATAQTNAQFRIINVATPSAPTSSATVNLSVTANDVTVNGTTAYIATATNAGSGELRIYNVATPTAPASLGSYEVGGNVTGVDIDPSNASYVLLATAVSTKQVVIVNVAAPSAPTLVNNVNYGSTTNKVMISGSYAYFGTADTAQELMILYTGFRPNGTFESSTFDPGANVGYNSLAFTTAIPSGASLQFQVAANNTGSGWSYLGPDGTASTFYTVGSPIPYPIVSNRYFRYKAFFTPTANGQQSPVISDVTVNYSK